jgi:hypothetical protein
VDVIVVVAAAAATAATVVTAVAADAIAADTVHCRAEGHRQKPECQFNQRPRVIAAFLFVESSNPAASCRRKLVYELILKRFEKADEVRVFEKGKFEIVHLGGMTIGRATYEPGWKWSVHVGKAAGQKSCLVEHVGMVVSGCATAAMDDGRIVEMRAGDVFYIEPGHDSWVVGEEPYVSLHFMGAGEYAKHK